MPRLTRSSELLAPNGHRSSSELLVNLGIYTRAPSAAGGGVAFTRALEEWGLANDCRKLLYSANYYELHQLWATAAAPHMLDRAAYDALRARVGASGGAGGAGQPEPPRPDLAERVLSVLRARREMSPLDAALVAVVEGLL